MAQVIRKRVTAAIEGDFVVFLIGMRINKLWKPWKWVPVFFAMPRMVRELEQSPDSGFLGAATLHGKSAAADAGPVLALIRAPGVLCAKPRRVALAGMGRVQQAHRIRR